MCRRMGSVLVRVERTGATGQNKSRRDASLATDSITWKCQRWKSEGKKNKKLHKQTNLILMSIHSISTELLRSGAASHNRVDPNRECRSLSVQSSPDSADRTSEDETVQRFLRNRSGPVASDEVDARVIERRVNCTTGALESAAAAAVADVSYFFPGNKKQ